MQDVIQDPPLLRKEATKNILLKRSHRITAGLLNDITHTYSISKKREKRLKRNKDVQNALAMISSKEQVLQNSKTIQDVDKVHTLRMEHRSTMRSFEHTNTHLKERRTRHLRNLRALTKLGAAERRYAQDHVMVTSEGNYHFFLILHIITTHDRA